MFPPLPFRFPIFLIFFICLKQLQVKELKEKGRAAREAGGGGGGDGGGVDLEMLEDYVQVGDKLPAYLVHDEAIVESFLVYARLLNVFVRFVDRMCS